MNVTNENADEIWNVYDKDRNLTDKTHKRGEPLAEGEFHLVVHVCIFNCNNQLLVQQRQPWKKGWPGMWDLSVGGSALWGEDSRKAAVREVQEELGIQIDLDHESPRFTVRFEGGFDDYWIITKNVDLKDLKLQAEEVKDVKWVNQEELQEMFHKGIFIPYYFRDRIFELKDASGAIRLL